MVRVFFVALIFGFFSLAARAQQPQLPPPSERYPFATGTIEQLDLAGQRLGVRTPVGPRVFGVTPRTYIFRGKEKISLDKLKIGESIKLSYRTNEQGQALVTRIKVVLPDTTADPPRAPDQK
jgi:hypothetical protein